MVTYMLKIETTDGNHSYESSDYNCNYRWKICSIHFVQIVSDFMYDFLDSEHNESTHFYHDEIV